MYNTIELIGYWIIYEIMKKIEFYSQNNIEQQFKKRADAND